MPNAAKWQAMTESTDRLPVPGGWLYRTIVRESLHAEPSSVALAFVADPDAEHVRRRNAA